MLLEKIIIKNFKSISEIELSVKKYGDSYATFFLGLNESGKSNILNAMSFFNGGENSIEYNYNELKNMKDYESEFVDIFFYLKFKNKQIYLEAFWKQFPTFKNYSFDINGICKNVYLEKDETKFVTRYDYQISNISSPLYVKKDNDSILVDLYLADGEELTSKNFIDFFGETIDKIILENEPLVSFWKPSEKYLISEVNLNDFKNDINSNIPLKNIFSLCGFETQTKIKEQLEQLSNKQHRRRIMSLLSKKTTEYIKSIWKHNIIVDIEISSDNICSVSIKDDGKNNEHDFYEMSDRSEGFKQFMSLILSLSIENNVLSKKERLILIDEPENHLHPSGIRDLGKELISIGKKNFLFVSTHSPFIIDTKFKQRHIIIKKDSYANSIKKEINEFEDLRDDEVLSQAFGINIYKDLLISKRILVEGYSDKLILQKLFNKLELSFGITNGAGSNIVQIASRLNDEDIDILVLVDSDEEGIGYKKKISKIGGVFSEKNIFTLKDLVPTVLDESTIEDFLGKGFVQSVFNKLFKEEFNKTSSLELTENTPFLKQMKIYLNQEGEGEKVKEFFEKIKIKLSEEIEFNKSNLNEKFPLLLELGQTIKSKLN